VFYDAALSMAEGREGWRGVPYNGRTLTPRLQTIMSMWRAGNSLDEIHAAVQGSKRGIYSGLARLRGLGFDVPHRHRARGQAPVPRALRVPLSHDPCAYCGGPANQIDHIDSRSRGGADDGANLTAACGPCNTAKGNRSLLKFLIVRRIRGEIAALEAERTAASA
jgi:hypothetical protein